MTIQIDKEFNDKMTTISIGDYRLYFSYETLVGIKLLGEFTIVHTNIWGSVTGKHLNSIPGIHTRVNSEVFFMVNKTVEERLIGKLTAKQFSSRINRLIEG